MSASVNDMTCRVVNTDGTTYVRMPKEHKQEQVWRAGTEMEEITAQTNDSTEALAMHTKMIGETVMHLAEH